MASNDPIILDSTLVQRKQELASTFNNSDFFEAFTFDQLLKRFELSWEDICFGKVGGGDDGGIDGFFFFINGDLIKEDIDPSDFKRKPQLELLIIQSKRSIAFSENIFQKINTTIQDIFDLSKDMQKLASFYNSGIIEKATIFRNSYLSLASKHPSLDIYYYYASKGNKSKIHSKIINEAKLLKDNTAKFFSESEIKTEFYGAKELLELSRIEKTYTLSLNFVENVLSKGDDNYVLLTSIKDYYNFIIDDSSHLRSYIFDSNVRDFQGYIEVNKDILNTLSNENSLDFWWLNNGITILASKASVTGKTINLDNVQIINGLQTTRCIFDYCNTKINKGEILSKDDISRSILVKIIVIQNDDAQDRIIKATNFQTSIPPASFKATEKIHKDIEDFFKGKDLFYDRRKNYYKNIGKPLNKIISIPLLTQSLNTILRMEPHVSRSRPSSLVKSSEIYDQLFNDIISPETYLICAQIVKKVENRSREQIHNYTYQEKTNLKFHISLCLVIKKLNKRNYHLGDLSSLKIDEIGDDLIDATLSEVINLTRSYMKKNKFSLELSSKSKELTYHLINNIKT